MAILSSRVGKGRHITNQDSVMKIVIRVVVVAVAVDEAGNEARKTMNGIGICGGLGELKI